MGVAAGSTPVASAPARPAPSRAEGEAAVVLRWEAGVAAAGGSRHPTAVGVGVTRPLLRAAAADRRTPPVGAAEEA